MLICEAKWAMLWECQHYRKKRAFLTPGTPQTSSQLLSSTETFCWLLVCWVPRARNVGRGIWKFSTSLSMLFMQTSSQLKSIHFIFVGYDANEVQRTWLHSPEALPRTIHVRVHEIDQLPKLFLSTTQCYLKNHNIHVHVDYCIIILLHYSFSMKLSLKVLPHAYTQWGKSLSVCCRILCENH